MVSCASLIGTRSSARNCPTLRCVSGSKERIDSSASPKKSSLTGAARPAHRGRGCRRAPHNRRRRAPCWRASSRCLEPVRERLHVDAVAGRGRKGGLADLGSAAARAGSGVDGGDQNARPLGARRGAREPRQRRHPPRGDRGVGRDAVVGLAVPRGQMSASISGAAKASASMKLCARWLRGRRGQRDRALFRPWGQRGARSATTNASYPRAHGRASARPRWLWRDKLGGVRVFTSLSSLNGPRRGARAIARTRACHVRRGSVLRR